MNIVRGLHNLKTHSGSAVTIGNFDGIHLGHQQIIKKLVASAKKLRLKSVLLSFTPTPQYFFGQQQASLTNFKEKHRLLSDLALDEHLLIDFNQAFAELSASAFVRQILLDKLNIKHCLIGDDFRFGKNRQGDFDLLKNLSATNGFSVESIQSVICADGRVSSSKIRGALGAGNISKAAQMLGREFSISGKIIRGQQKGRTIGFPTINIPIKRNISPVLGVFAVNIKLSGATYNGVCNIGKRPTVGGEKTLLEVFVFNFDEDVYNAQAEVIFKHKIRNEQKFDSFEALKMQIQLDAQTAKEYFD